MASRIDACSSRIETAVRMGQVTDGMKGVVKGMDKGLASMDVEKISKLMDKFEQQFEDFSEIKCFKPFSKHFFGATSIWLTPHDLRRTFASTARMAGVQQNTISWLMNHSSSRDHQTARYQGRPESYVLKEALLQIEAVYRRFGYTDA